MIADRRWIEPSRSSSDEQARLERRQRLELRRADLARQRDSWLHTLQIAASQCDSIQTQLRKIEWYLEATRQA